jgi:hypothetical protein
LERTPALARRIACAIALTCAAVTYDRLHFGIDLHDEAYYVATAYRFVLGDRPLLDDMTPHQTASLLMAPLVRLHRWFQGSPDGIILFVRLGYLAFAAAVAACVSLGLAGAVSAETRWLLVAFCLAYAPFNIFTLGYNTLGSGLLAAGLFLGLRGLLHGRESRGPWLLLGGLAQGFAVFAYPTLVVSAGVSVVAAAALSRGARLAAAARWAGGLSVGGGALGWLALRAGEDGLAHVLAYSRAQAVEVGQGGGVEKLATILWQFATQSPPALPLVATLLVALSAHRRAPLLTAVLLPVLVTVVFFPALSDADRAAGGVIYLGALAPLLLVVGPRDRLARMLLLGVWLPSTAAGAATAWTSSNGMANACIGMLAAGLVGFVLLARAIGEALSRTALPAPRRIAAFVLVAPVGLTLHFQRAGDAVYWDARPADLTAEVAGGPYAGIRTTPQRRALIDALGADVARFSNPEGRLLVYWGVPAVYLMTSMRPAGPSVWIEPRPTTSALEARYYVDHFHPSNVVVRGNWRRAPVTPLDQAVFALHQIAFRRPEYVILTGSNPRRPAPTKVEE